MAFDNQANDVTAGNSLFNMGAATMSRIDSLIRQITFYKSVLYQQGSPMHSLILRLQLELYVELHPYLDNKERQVAYIYRKIFIKYPIINTGHSLIINSITEQAMEDFQLWTMDKLKEKGLLTPLAPNPLEDLVV
jgi:hypothetical protein